MENKDSLENEKTIIGHIIRFPERASEIMEGLEPGDFSSPKHAAIFGDVRDNLGEGFDILTLSNTLKVHGWKLNPSDLIAFEEWAFDGVDLSMCKEKIKTESQKRSFAHYLNITLEEIKKPESDLTSIHDDLQKKLLDLQAGITTEKLLKQPSDFREEILNPKHSKPMLTGMESFDKLLGGLRINEVSVLTGETASGKTTIGAAFLPYVLSQKGHSVLIASFEMKPPMIQKKMIQMTMGRPFVDLSRPEKEQGLDFIEQLPLHFIDAYGQIGLRELKGSIFSAFKQFGIDLVVLDHLHFFLKYSPDHERQAIDAALVEIKTWAMQLGIHILIIVHPTKLETENRPVRMNDLKGSSGLKQIPDNIFSIWRPRGNDDLSKAQNEVILYILKCRDDSGDEGKVILNFDKRSQSYTDSGPGFARPAEGRKGSGLSSPSSRPPERNWVNGYDQ